MCSISVMPMPSMMSTPKWPVHRRYRAAGSASPAEAASRTPASASAGSSARSMLAKKVGPAKNSVAPYSRARAASDVRPRRRRFEHRGRPGREREQHRVAQPVGEERLGRGQAAVVGADAEHLRAVGLADERGSRRAGASRPWACRSCRRCRARTPASPRWSGSVDVSGAGAARPAGARAAPRRARRRRPASTPRSSGASASAAAPRRRRTPGDREQPGPRVAQQLGDAVGAGHGRDRHGHGAHAHGGEVGDDELRRVGHEHAAPLLGLQPEPRAGPPAARSTRSCSSA